MNLRRYLWLLYVLLIALGAAHHEHFRDETDTWGMVRDASWAQAIPYFSHSGHPPLWHALQWLPARLSGNVAWLGALHTFIASAGAALLLFTSPLPTYLAAAALFSIGGLYQYAVIARGYAAAFVVLFAIAALHRGRMQRPYVYSSALGLLYATEVHLWGAAAGLSGLWFLDIWRTDDSRRRKVSDLLQGLLRRVGCEASSARRTVSVLNVRADLSTETTKQAAADVGFARGLLPVVVSGALMLWLMWPRADGNPKMNAVHLPNSTQMLYVLSQCFTPVLMFYYTLGIDPDGSYGDPLFWLVCLNALLLLGILWRLCRCGARVQWLLFSTLGFYGFVIFCKYLGGYHHIGLLPFFLLFFTRFAAADGVPLARLQPIARRLAVGFALSIPLAFIVWTDDLRRPYSSAEAAAEIVRRDADPAHPIIALGCTRSDALAAYLPPGTVYFAEQHRTEAFHDWGARNENCFLTNTDHRGSVRALHDALHERMREQIFTVTSPFPLPEDPNYTLQQLGESHDLERGAITSFNISISESFYLYRLTRR